MTERYATAARRDDARDDAAPDNTALGDAAPGDTATGGRRGWGRRGWGRRGWGGRIAGWAEQLIPRVVGAVFLWAGIGKAIDPSKIHRVFAFDGVPQPVIAPLTHVVWVAEVILAVVLLAGIARRNAVIATILVLFVYSVQLAYLIAADNPPRDCGCVALIAKYASAKQALGVSLVRNAVMAACLEWVRLRIVRREQSVAPPAQ